MNKLFTKEIIRVNQTLPTKLNSKNELLQSVVEAETPQDLINAIIVVAGAKDYYKKAKAKFNDKLKEAQTGFKETNADIASVERAIKERGLELYKKNVSTTVKQDINDQTGEVKEIVKVTETSNLGKGVFTYTAGKETTEIDVQAILAEKETYKDFIDEKIVYSVNMDRVRSALEANAVGFPMKFNKTDAKLGIQWKSVKEKADKLLESEDL